MSCAENLTNMLNNYLSKQSAKDPNISKMDDVEVKSSASVFQNLQQHTVELLHMINITNYYTLYNTYIDR